MLPYFVAYGPPVASQSNQTSYFVSQGNTSSAFTLESPVTTDYVAGIASSRGIAYCLAFGDGGFFVSCMEGNTSRGGGKPSELSYVS
jgi:hypothetical protein